VNVDCLVTHITNNYFIFFIILRANFASFAVGALPRKSFYQVYIKGWLVTWPMIDLGAPTASQSFGFFTGDDLFLASDAKIRITTCLLFLFAIRRIFNLDNGG
jgi:hypothetical protein